MKHSTCLTAIAALALCMVVPAQAGILQGQLELKWGDALPDSVSPPRFTAMLVTDDGVRHALDVPQALHAAENLYALANRRVAIDFDTDARHAARAGAMRIQAIVPADRVQQPAATANLVSGTTRWVTLMCKFSDIATEQKPQSFFESQYGNAPGQLDHYWREVSYNKINLTGSHAVGWFTLPQPRSYYVTGTGSDTHADLGKLFADCTKAADASVDFAAGGGLQGINMMFNGDLDGYAWGGGQCAKLDGLDKCWSTTWDPPWAFGNLAPLAHEMGHGYGLPHANNSDGDSNPYDNPWDVMSDAWSNAASSATYGAEPKHINVYHRDQLGWIDAARKLTLQAGSQQTGIVLDRASLSGSGNVQMIVVRVPGQPTSRYYTVEARTRVGTYEPKLAGDAVIIHAIDTTRSEPAWSVDTSVPPADTANNEGSMFKSGETWTAPSNAFRVRVVKPTTQGFLVSVCKPAVSGTRRKAGLDGATLPAFDSCDRIGEHVPDKPGDYTPPSTPHLPPCKPGTCATTVATTRLPSQRAPSRSTTP